MTSYQGPSTIGNRLEKGEREFAFSSGGNKQEIVRVKAEFHSLHGLTGHSTYKQLMNYLNHVSPKPRKVIFVHGESSRCLEMASTIHRQLRIETAAPKNLETIRLR